MGIVTLAEVKAHLSFTDDIGTVDDALLTRISAAAETHLERKLGFTFAEEFGAPGQDALPEPLQHAVLMLTAHWYENRELMQTTMAEMPFGVSDIIREYREWTF